MDLNANGSSRTRAQLTRIQLANVQAFDNPVDFVSCARLAIAGHPNLATNMARLFRLLGKKRGERRTGSRLIGALGEASFFGVLFLLGTVSLVSLISTQINSPTQDVYSLGFGFWLMVMVLGSFTAIGGGGIIYIVMQAGTSAERRSAIARAATMHLIHEAVPQSQDYPTIPLDENITNSPGVALPFRLPVSQSAMPRMIVLTLFCLLWDGITCVLATLAVLGHWSGNPDWTLTTFSIPFLAVGIWTTQYFVRQMLSHTRFSPTIVEISDHPLIPGQTYQVFFSQAGKLSLKRLRFSLVCDEEATYQQGTDIRTENRAVYRQSIFREDDLKIEPGTPFEIQCDLQLPKSAMHTFRSNHNAINWKLVVRAKATSSLKIKREFPIIVMPINDELPSN